MRITLQIALVIGFTLFSTHSPAETILKLNEVEIAQECLPERSFLMDFEETFHCELESYSKNCTNAYIADHNAFLEALHISFAQHRPLRISPDHIWLVLAQGFAAHVNHNSVKLREKIVRHTGKATLSVRRDDFIKGKMENPWEEVFPELCQQMGEYVEKDLINSVTAKFSTTTPIEQAAFQITLMDALQNYFSYEVVSFCGIPSLILEGTPADWKALKERTKSFEKYELTWWTKDLEPILQEFINASEGRVNVEFWNSMYKDDGVSGGPFVTGWISKLFPYLKGDGKERYRVNPIFQAKHPEEVKIQFYSFPTGISKAPFTWDCFYRNYEMEFLGGFVGLTQDVPSKTIRPEIGWIVRENPEKFGFFKRLIKKWQFEKKMKRRYEEAEKEAQVLDSPSEP
ncbi:MAG: DUF4419 domain-containing protein [Kiritimatiellaceae bacterium]|nr:DUF4419 domain-containing protein [Kiritimatiellaceae bacterium]